MRAPALALLTLCACGTPPEPEPDAGPEVFVAFQRDFANYPTWRSFQAGSDPIDSVHTAGPRTIYLNRTPPKGATAFPVGTVLVKHIDGGQVFAMAKRGGGYNASGAKGWEWFELKAGDDGQPVIAWRGVAPPAGEGYGAASGGACNTCHQAHADNDFVSAPELRLSTIE